MVTNPNHIDSLIVFRGEGGIELKLQVLVMTKAVSNRYIFLYLKQCYYGENTGTFY